RRLRNKYRVVRRGRAERDAARAATMWPLLYPGVLYPAVEAVVEGVQLLFLQDPAAYRRAYHGARGGVPLPDRLGRPVSGRRRVQGRDGGGGFRGRLLSHHERRDRLRPHGGQALKKLFAERIEGLAQSDIRRMSLECARVNGINLGQGICDQPIEPIIKQAASE